MATPSYSARFQLRDQPCVPRCIVREHDVGRLEAERPEFSWTAAAISGCLPNPRIRQPVGREEEAVDIPEVSMLKPSLTWQAGARPPSSRAAGRRPSSSRGQAGHQRRPDDFGRFTEVRGTHDRRGDDAELFRLLAAEVIEAVRRAAGDAQRLAGTHLDGCAVHRPGQDALDP